MCGSELALCRVPLGESFSLLGTYEDPLARAWEADVDDMVKAGPCGCAPPRSGLTPPWAREDHIPGLSRLGRKSLLTQHSLRGHQRKTREKSKSPLRRYGNFLSPTPKGSSIDAQPPSFPPTLRVFPAAIYWASATARKQGR